MTAMLVELNTIPAWPTGSLDSAAMASPAPDPVAKGSSASSSEIDVFPEALSFAKGDRLFAIRAPEPASETTDSLGEQDDQTAPAAIRQELSMGEFCEALTAAAEASDIPAPFFARLIWQESKFKPNEVSPVGAQGVAQFMPKTAVEMGLADPFDPRQALPASARFLRKLHDQFGNLGLAAAAYNAGSGRIQNWLARRGPLPEETRNYVRKITGNPAEKWTAEAKTVELQQELPRTAPCEGVGGLSRTKEVAEMPVALTPGISGIIRKAEAAAAAAKARIRLALLKGSKRRMAATKLAAAGKAEDAAKATDDNKASSKTVAARKTPAVKLAANGHRKKLETRRVKVASAGK